MKLLKLVRNTAIALVLLFAVIFFVSQMMPTKDDTFDVLPTGVEAYIYGYPLVSMEINRRVMTNVAAPDGAHTPMGQFARMRTFPTASFHEESAPNADTLYTMAWVSVDKEPWVLSLPDAHDRYYLFPMVDGWTNVFQDPGKRTTGTGPQTYAITGPDWKGVLPAGVTEYKSPTNIVWLLGRIYCTGTPEDYDAVHKMQDEISIVPLNSYNKPYTPPPGTVDPSIDMKTPVRDQVNKLSVTEYFTLLARLMKDNPPAEADKPILARMARIGIVPGQPFDGSKLGLVTREVFDEVPAIAQEKIKLWTKEGLIFGDMKLEHGWAYTTKIGIYGTDYNQRALFTYYGMGANRPQDAIYPISVGPNALETYTGEKKYVMHFDKGQMPPAHGFWSLTMYDKSGCFIANSINRYNVSGHDNLKSNPDGSVDLYIQNENPGADREANWLPAPKDTFVLMLRLYWPDEKDPSILNGSWSIPPVKPVE